MDKETKKGIGVFAFVVGILFSVGIIFHELSWVERSDLAWVIISTNIAVLLGLIGGLFALFRD